MTKKSPEMEQMCEQFANKLFNRSLKDPVCVTCGSDKVKPNDFKDALSRKEFSISHICQKCQDSIFECDDDDEYDDTGCFDFSDKE